MKNIKLILIASIVLMFIGGVIDHIFFLPPEGKIEIKPPTVSETTWTDKEHAKNTSPIQISGRMNDDVLRVNAWDDEKSAYADFPISCNPVIKRNIIGINYILSKKINPNYYYKLNDWLAIGGGAIIPLKDNLRNSELLVGMQYCY